MYILLLLVTEALAAQGKDFLQAAIKRSWAASRDRNEAKKCPLVLVVVTMLMALGMTKAVRRFSMAVISENAITSYRINHWREKEKKKDAVTIFE